ncbi:MAG: hypothetical protein SCALA701_13930 [Candidatus Scalindua sp.]|nr:hypothetical protein [Planctomycetota bacterium]GJQ58592.1 MAG: hypothetical protein SCALA701_13930 [Candidatus Scalindua sp.]
MENSYSDSKANSEIKRKKYGTDTFSETMNSWEKQRPCLKCGREFASQGPYHRICERCKLINVRYHNIS